MRHCWCRERVGEAVTCVLRGVAGEPLIRLRHGGVCHLPAGIVMRCVCAHSLSQRLQWARLRPHQHDDMQLGKPVDSQYC